MKRRAVIDVAELPDVAFSHHAPLWWGNFLMLIIEGVAFAILAASYFYIRRNFDTWPPTRTLLPDMGVSSLNVLLLLVSIVPFWYAAKLAYAEAAPTRIGLWLLLGVLFGLVAIFLRVLEFKGVHTRYDSNAYGSIVWTILGVHMAHLIAGTLETLANSLVMIKGPIERKHFLDVAVTAVYWYFVALSWVAMWAIVFVAPRFI